MLKSSYQSYEIQETDSNQSVSHETCNSDLIFENLVWMTTEDAAKYLRKSKNAIRIMVYRRVLKARKFKIDCILEEKN